MICLSIFSWRFLSDWSRQMLSYWNVFPAYPWHLTWTRDVWDWKGQVPLLIWQRTMGSLWPRNLNKLFLSRLLDVHRANCLEKSWHKLCFILQRQSNSVMEVEKPKNSDSQSSRCLEQNCAPCCSPALNWDYLWPEFASSLGKPLSCTDLIWQPFFQPEIQVPITLTLKSEISSPKRNGETSFCSFQILLPEWTL